MAEAAKAVKLMSVRPAAARLLAAVMQGQSLSRALPLFQSRVKEKDQALLAELAYGSCRWFYQLQVLLGLLLKKPLRKRDAEIHALLLTGLYQLIHTRIKSHAAVTETVKAARQLGKPALAGLVNGVLRQYLRESESLLQKAEKNNRYACPEWFADRLKKAWPGQWSEVLEQFLQYPPMTLRVNHLRQNTSDYAKRLADKGITGRPIKGVSTALMLDRSYSVEDLPGFFDGDVSVQDAGAQLAALLLNLSDGLTVLDACAAPGGKTGHILESAGQLEVTAVDVEQARLKKVDENLLRLQLKADVLVGDASKPEGAWAQKQYDRILLDVPCSATGVIRRHPDIKLLRREEDINKLAQQQRLILQAIWPLLKPGGQLLYATCSVLPQENQAQVDWFIENHKEAFELPLQTTLGQACSFGRQVLPDSQMDGFYYARLGKHEKTNE